MKKTVFISAMSAFIALSMISCAFFEDETEDYWSERKNTSSSSTPYVLTKYSDGMIDAAKTQDKWEAVNCHDPKLFQDDDGTYYVYATDASCGNIGYTGIHIRYSTDLVNWKGVSHSAISGHWDEDFLAWEGFKASSSDVKQGNSNYTAVTWAPTVIKQNGLYNADVSMGGSKYACSSIVLAIASNAKGPFYPASYISSYTGSNSTVKAIKSTLEALGVEYKQNFLVRYCPYNIGAKGSITSEALGSNGAAIDGTEFSIPDYSKCNNNRYGCIDPEFVYDISTGEIKTYTIGSNTCYAMTYGSWLNGIVLCYVDADSLKPVALGNFTYNDVSYTLGDEMDISFDEAACTTSVSNAMIGHSNSSSSDRFLLLGVPLIGGASTTSAPSNGAATAYEGAQLIYNSETNYYYMITSCGALKWEYRCAIGRSSSINGEYDDAGGVDMWLGTSNYAKYHEIGSKIIGSHVLESEYSFRSQGGLSVLRTKNGKIMFACHSRTNFQPEYYFYLQCHQMFFNAEGWPVLNQNEYYDNYSGITDDGSESFTALSLSKIAGTYYTIMTVRGTTTSTAAACGLYGGDSTSVNEEDATPTTSREIVISSSGEISGAYSGSVTLGSDGYSATIKLNNLGTFYGYFMNAMDWARKDSSLDDHRTITFTTLCSDTSATEKGEYFWGNRVSN